MTIHLDHFIASTRDKVASAKLLAELLGVEWAESGAGPFSPVYINIGLTLDFIDTDEPFPIEHYCFRVGQEEFDAILGRLKAAGIKYRSSVRGPRATFAVFPRSAARSMPKPPGRIGMRRRHEPS